MATRSEIIVEGVDEVKVYKHWDGYPSATLPWLEWFNKRFTARRGEQQGYKFAQLLRSSIADAKEYDLDDSRFTGWGVYPIGEDTGAEYIYTLNIDGSVTVEEV